MVSLSLSFRTCRLKRTYNNKVENQDSYKTSIYVVMNFSAKWISLIRVILSHVTINNASRIRSGKKIDNVPQEIPLHYNNL